MVSCKEEDRDPRVSHLRKLAQQPDKSFRDGVFVFKPEVEDVAQQVDGMGVMPDAVQPLNDVTLPLKARFVVWHSQVEVGREVDLFTAQGCYLSAGHIIATNARRHKAL